MGYFRGLSLFLGIRPTGLYGWRVNSSSGYELECQALNSENFATAKCFVCEEALQLPPVLSRTSAFFSSTATSLISQLLLALDLKRTGYGLAALRFCMLQVLLALSGFSTIYISAMFRLQLLRCIVLPPTVIQELGCSNAAEIVVEMLLGDICKNLLPIATVTHVCLRQTLTSCRMEEAPCFQCCELHYEFHVPKQ